MNEPGLTHISLSVDDIDATLRAASPSSAARWSPARNIGAAVFIRDPDGQLLELLPMAYRRQLDS